MSETMIVKCSMIVNMMLIRHDVYTSKQINISTGPLNPVGTYPFNV